MGKGSEEGWRPRHAALSPLDRIPRSRTQALTRLAGLLSDLAAVAIASLLAYVGRSRLPIFSAVEDVTGSSLSTSVLIALTWIACNALLSAYSAREMGSGSWEFQRVAFGGMMAAGVVGIACYLMKYDLSRGYFLLLFAIGIPLMLIFRLILRRTLNRAHRRGVLQRRVLIAGTPQHIDDVVKVLTRESWLGYTVVGAMARVGWSADETPGGVPFVGATKNVVDLVEQYGADAVVFTEGSFPTSADFRRTAWELESLDAQMIVVPALSDISSQRVQVRPVAGLPLLFVEPPQREAAAHLSKRVFDLVGSAGLLVLFSPVFLITALVIWLDDRGPVIFRQTRVGLDGKEFTCLKFRSMVVNAEEVLKQIQHLNQADGVLFKMENDPRITKPGRFIRRYSVDELPQLWNVLRGDMSLIGPRPPLPKEVANYQSDVVRRLRVRPGMTGLWQVSGRSDLSWDDTVRLDLYYVDNWSMVQDLTILLRTFQAVFGRSGAY